MKKAYFICVALLILIFAGIIYTMSQSYFEYNAERKALAAELKKELEINLRLEREKEQYMSDAYVERIARELGLVRHDEIVFINER